MVNSTENPSIRLASSSPRRADLLTAAGVDFIVCPPNVDEHELEQPLPRQTAHLRAYWKALSCVGSAAGEQIILGADTVIELDGRALGKPVSRADARDTLRKLSGRSCEALTSVTALRVSEDVVIDELSSTVLSTMTMNDYDEHDIDCYLDTGEYLGKAGSFAIQGLGRSLVSRVDGCFSNIVGLPVCRTLALLQFFGQSVDQVPFDLSCTDGFCDHLLRTSVPDSMARRGVSQQIPSGLVPAP